MSSPATRPGDWEALGAVPPDALTDAWRQVHWALQVPAAFASAAIEARSDDSHANLGWDGRLGGLVTHRAGRVAMGLRFRGLALVMLEGDRETGSLALDGKTLADGLAWAGETASSAQVPLRGELVRRSWDMPEHDVGGGGRFGVAAGALDEVARWYADTDRVLVPLAAATPGASEVRCWPHHFDIATLVSLGGAAGGGEARSIGLGLAPADGSVAEPYFYVNPWPPPESSGDAPPLEAGGEWFSEGWFGAVLRGTRLVEGDAAGQRERLELFLRSAIAAGRRVLGEEGR